VDITLKAVTLASGKGALGTGRSPAGQRCESEEPACSDEPEGKLERRGVYASQRLSLLVCRKAFRGKPGSERYSGNPTVADRRGACGNVDSSRARRSSIPTPATRHHLGLTSLGEEKHNAHASSCPGRGGKSAADIG
jgi:hypothetical protein